MREEKDRPNYNNQKDDDFFKPDYKDYEATKGRREVNEDKKRSSNQELVEFFW